MTHGGSHSQVVGKHLTRAAGVTVDSGRGLEFESLQAHHLRIGQTLTHWRFFPVPRGTGKKRQCVSVWPMRRWWACRDSNSRPLPESTVTPAARVRCFPTTCEWEPPWVIDQS